MKKTCAWCDEPIAASDAAPMFHDNPVHRECAVRLIAGSVGHQEKRCACFGGDMEDPPNMTKRQAARAAALVFEMTGRQPDFTELDNVGRVVAKIAVGFKFEGDFFVADMAVVGPDATPNDELEAVPDWLHIGPANRWPDRSRGEGRPLLGDP